LGACCFRCSFPSLDVFFHRSPPPLFFFQKQKPILQAIPLVNITLPLVYKSFGACYAADMVLLAGVFAWKLGGKEGGEEA
jgi:hypothetical protein